MKMPRPEVSVPYWWTVKSGTGISSWCIDRRTNGRQNRGMTTSRDKTVDERLEEQRQREESMRQQLAERNLDGPYNLHPGGWFDPLSAMLGSVRDKYAICLTCGAVVMLNDSEERDGRQIERSVRLHVMWHETAGA